RSRSTRGRSGPARQADDGAAPRQPTRARLGRSRASLQPMRSAGAGAFLLGCVLGSGCGDDTTGATGGGGSGGSTTTSDATSSSAGGAGTGTGDPTSSTGAG